LNNYSFDTHSLVWYFQGKNTLSTKAFVCLEEVFSGKSFGYVSVIVILEAYHLSLKKNKKFIFPKFLEWLSVPSISIVPFDFAIAKECFLLPKELEIHDRVIVATAKTYETLLVTRDRVIIESKVIETIW